MAQQASRSRHKTIRLYSDKTVWCQRESWDSSGISRHYNKRYNSDRTSLCHWDFHPKYVQKCSLGYAPPLRQFYQKTFSDILDAGHHLEIEDLNHSLICHHNLIKRFLGHTHSFPKISPKPAHTRLSNLADKRTIIGGNINVIGKLITGQLCYLSVYLTHFTSHSVTTQSTFEVI